MKSSKRQSLIVIGFGLIILSGIFLYFALSMPRVSISSTDNSYSYSQTDASAVTAFADSVQSNSTYIYDIDDNIDLSVNYPLNLNTCTVQELMTVDGIGEKKASDIIEYREYLGGYTSVDQIMNIKGIGEGVYEKVAPYLTV